MGWDIASPWLGFIGVVAANSEGDRIRKDAAIIYSRSMSLARTGTLNSYQVNEVLLIVTVELGLTFAIRCKHEHHIHRIPGNALCGARGCYLRPRTRAGYRPVYWTLSVYCCCGKSVTWLRSANHHPPLVRERGNLRRFFWCIFGSLSITIRGESLPVCVWVDCTG